MFNAEMVTSHRLLYLFEISFVIDES